MTSTPVDIREAKMHLARVMNQAAAGQDVILGRRGNQWLAFHGLRRRRAKSGLVSSRGACGLRKTLTPRWRTPSMLLSKLQPDAGRRAAQVARPAVAGLGDGRCVVEVRLVSAMAPRAARRFLCRGAHRATAGALRA